MTTQTKICKNEKQLSIIAKETREYAIEVKSIEDDILTISLPNGINLDSVIEAIKTIFADKNGILKEYKFNYVKVKFNGIDIIVNETKLDDIKNIYCKKIEEYEKFNEKVMKELEEIVNEILSMYEE